MALKLKIIIGSTRPSRLGPKVAQWFEGAAREHGKFEVELLDLADFNLPVFDEPKHPRMRDYSHDHTKKWSAAIEPADAYVFVTPEYNYYPPSSLINALDYLVLEWGRKPAAVVSYGGISGGLRATEALRPLLATLNMMPIPQALPVPLFGTMIGEDGVFRPTDPIAQGVKPMLDELAIWAEGLQAMRRALS
ncbi:NADPH-dependent FMN reductase [Tianweitania populi]|uniref:FMN reductase n=1 Tax=Tianweitania populi TaxID=1607949 RepID=A0A8J3DXI9_9HYPH|nr:NAD(P)H-dependent oxidoreductase [Tianweitania populi]GHD16325.1 FMN reductase [Tianweitania populi]